MLRQIADGVLIHESEFVQANGVVVHGRAGASLIDPGVHESEMVCLAHDLSDSGQSVVAGFSTHPHWDHLLWHASFGEVPRYGTARCTAGAREGLAEEIDPREHGIPDEVSLDLLGLIEALPDETVFVPWDGPRVRIVEHQAHAPGHAALLVEERGVLVAGDMVSDVLIPLLDFDESADPIEDYLAALGQFDGVARDVEVFVPGHGSIGGPQQLRTRIDMDRAYLEALREGRVVNDPRFSLPYSKDWLPGVHAQQLQSLLQKIERGT